MSLNGISKINTFKILDLPFVASSHEEIRLDIESLIKENQGASVIFANAHVIAESSQDNHLHSTLMKATRIIPDGVPVAWLLQAMGHKAATRYSGPDLMSDIFKSCPDKRHFFLGSTPETLEKMKLKFKGRAVGFYSPPFSEAFNEEEKQKHIHMINEARADFIWVGLGAPKQEKYVVEMAHRADSRGVWLAVGAAFDFYGGTKPRAPKTLQKLGLEWAHRLVTEPKRLAPRYLKTNPLFMKIALQELIKRKIS